MMRPRYLAALFFAAAVLAALAVGLLAVARVEARAESAAAGALAGAGHGWAEVQADGLKLFIRGTAPDEAERFAALGVAGEIVSPRNLRDRIEVVAPPMPDGPGHSLEIMQNGAAVSVIGLMPGEAARAALVSRIGALDGVSGVVDLTAHTGTPPEPGWAEALDFTVKALGLLRDSKISATAGAVSITAIAASPGEKARLEAALRRLLPADLALTLDISAPRPVITPFALDVTLSGAEVAFAACSANDEEARVRIAAAAARAGHAGPVDCAIGLGAPTEDWGVAVEAAIDTLGRLGGGRLTISDADMRLEARPGTEQAAFDTALARLRERLPEVFSLNAVLPEAPAEPVAADGTRGTGQAGDADPGPDFIATRSPEGLVQLRGLVTDPALREAVTSFARARFGSGGLHDTLRTDADLPEGWSVRVLAGLEGLAMLHNGSLTVTPEEMALRGRSDAPERAGQVAEVLARMLPEDAQPVLDIVYDESLDPQANLPTPAECMSRVAAVLDEEQIVFAPGESTIDAAAGLVVDRVAAVMKDCAEVEMQVEIGGHTDSQGRDGMNLALSQARAEAVLDALLARGVLTANMTARGYGSTVPVADNGTEDGREANRRIEIRLIAPAPQDADGADDTPGVRVITPSDKRPGLWIAAPPPRGEQAGDAATAEDGPDGQN